MTRDGDFVSDRTDVSVVPPSVGEAFVDPLVETVALAYGSGTRWFRKQRGFVVYGKQGELTGGFFRKQGLWFRKQGLRFRKQRWIRGLGDFRFFGHWGSADSSADKGISGEKPGFAVTAVRVI